MAFDLVSEKHYEVPKPEFSGMSRSLLSVEVMGGFLTAAVNGDKNGSDIWVMKEYGVKSSWSKLLRFDPPIAQPCMYLYPLAYSKNGDKVLLNYEGMCLNWYDLKTKEVTIGCVKNMTATFDAVDLNTFLDAEVCVGSLVSPHSPAGVGSERKKGGQGNKGKEIKKKRDGFLAVGFKLVL